MVQPSTRSSSIVQAASVIAVDQLSLTVTLNMTYVNCISLIELSIRGVLYPVDRPRQQFTGQMEPNSDLNIKSLSHNTHIIIICTLMTET